MDLKEWIQQNHLSVNHINDWQFEIEEVGKFYILESVSGKIVDKDSCFIIDDENYDRIDRLKPDFFVFQFGIRWYYSKNESFVDSKRITKYKFVLNEFLYLGKSTVDSSGFYHLGIHSCYELMNGSRYADDWVKKAKFINMKVLAICDKNTLAGVLEFQSNCDKKQIKPIIGETITVCYDVVEGIDITHEVKLYVKNLKGWKNLLRIGKIINVDNIEKQNISEKQLFELSEGLILVFSKESHINQDVDKYDNINEYIKYFPDIYYQVDTITYSSETEDQKHLDNLKFYFNNICDIIKPILINDSFYINKEENKVKKFLNDVDGKVNIQSEDQYFKTLDDVLEIMAPLFNEDKSYCESKGFEIIIQAIQNTVELSELCDFRIPVGSSKIPKYEFTENNEELFVDLISKGFDNLNITNPETLAIYEERVEREFKVIKDGELIDYFLIVWDIINWARENNISVGTGRGSVGGSLVAFLIGIITIDPIEHDLLFERFLNETRTKPEEFIELEFKNGTKKLLKIGDIFDPKDKTLKTFKNVKIKRKDSMPDIDTDFEANRRDEVKNYIVERFGKDHVCGIGSYTTIKMKGGLKDFSRVKGLTFSYVNFVTSQIPHQLEYNWSDLTTIALQKEPMRKYMQENYDICDLLNFTLEQPRAASEHASASVIVPKEDEDGNLMTIFDWMPIRKVKGRLISEWNGASIDMCGFLKEDILSLSQLDKFKMMVGLIKKNRGVDIVLEELPLDDKDTYRMFKKGFNEDVFQFTSGGLKAYSAKVKPDTFEELTAMTALYRPGPMKSNAHEDFADFKHGKKRPKFDPFMEVVTKDTFGLYIYQEQVMQAFIVAGMTPVEADNARTCIKKFDKNAMAVYRNKFISGLQNKGLTEKVSIGMWDKIMSFSSYGFNKSHSSAYTLMSYWSQYLKVKYPLEFWTSALNFCPDADEIPDRLSEFNKLETGIEIIQPDVNYSGKIFKCSAKTNKIYWSFSKIKGFADSSVDEILSARKTYGAFSSMFHFIDCVKKNKVNKGKIVNLIIAGAFDKIENITSPELRINLLKVYGEKIGQDLLEPFEKRNIEKDFYWIGLQRELTGFGDIDYKEMIKTRLKNFDKSLYLQYRTADDFFKPKDTKYVKICVAGTLTTAIEATCKNGKYVRFTVNSNNQVIKGTMWPEQFDKFPDFPKLKGKLIAISGTVNFEKYHNSNTLTCSDETKIIEL